MKIFCIGHSIILIPPIMKKLALIFTLLLYGSCEKDVFDENYRYLYGDWIPLQLSFGTNYIANPELLGDLIQIIKKDSYNLIKNDRIIETGKIVVELQTKTKLQLRFVPKEPYSGSETFVRLPFSTLNIVTYTQDLILLHNNAPDGGYWSVCLLK